MSCCHRVCTDPWFREARRKSDSRSHHKEGGKRQACFMRGSRGPKADDGVVRRSCEQGNGQHVTVQGDMEVLLLGGPPIHRYPQSKDGRGKTKSPTKRPWAFPGGFIYRGDANNSYQASIHKGERFDGPIFQRKVSGRGSTSCGTGLGRSSIFTVGFRGALLLRHRGKSGRGQEIGRKRPGSSGGLDKNPVKYSRHRRRRTLPRRGGGVW